MEALHSWSVDIQKARQIQEEFRHRVILEKTFLSVHKIGGGDVTYSATGPSLVGVVIVFSFPELKILETASATGKPCFPYVPGLLSFREGPALIEAFDRLRIKPDVMLFEGHGTWHPRGFGLASHLGLWLDIPSVGCAKTPLIRAPIRVGPHRGQSQFLREGEREIGAIVRTKENVKPVFVSPGHKIDLATSIELVLNTCRGYRIPDPIRIADQFGRRILRQVDHIADNN